MNFLILIFFIISLWSCKKLKTPESIAERENWYESFADSINYYEEQSRQIEVNFQEINSQISNLLNRFEKVNNPREVSGYYILKGWSGKVPLKSTGVYARINENEQLELIATLSGGTFNQLEIGNLYSEKVKHDQALNYRHDTFNTVYFTGGKADTIAEYISNHEAETLKLYFLEGNRKTPFTLPDSEKNMITQTWKLYSFQRETLKLQKQLAICARKIDTFRRLKDDHTQKNMEEAK